MKKRSSLQYFCAARWVVWATEAVPEQRSSDETNVPEWALFVITITGGTKPDEYGKTCAITANLQGVQREIET